MEHLHITFDSGGGKEFDKALKGTLPDGGDLKVITKERATAKGEPGVIITFTVQLPDGTIKRVQTVTTARLFANAGLAIATRYNLQ